MTGSQRIVSDMSRQSCNRFGSFASFLAYDPIYRFCRGDDGCIPATNRAQSDSGELGAATLTVWSMEVPAIGNDPDIARMAAGARQFVVHDPLDTM